MDQADSRPLSTRPFLGQGLAFPVRPVNGGLAMAVAEDSIEQAVELILRTSPGERVMLPGWGSGLRDFLFAGNGPVTHRAVEQAVRRALTDLEPRITVERVSAMAAPDEPNLMLIEIDYVVRRSNAFYNRVYPFYLNEAD